MTLRRPAGRIYATDREAFEAGVLPRAILLSGGGNDVAGNRFGVLLNHVQVEAHAGLNEQVVRGRHR